MPSANAIFFNGDQVEGTGNFVIERLSDVQKIAEILVSKFGSTINAWVIEANTFNGPFAVYKDFIPTVNLDGEPQSYNATGLPASSSIVLLSSNCLKEVNLAALIMIYSPLCCSLIFSDHITLCSFSMLKTHRAVILSCKTFIGD